MEKNRFSIKTNTCSGGIIKHVWFHIRSANNSIWKVKLQNCSSIFLKGKHFWCIATFDLPLPKEEDLKELFETLYTFPANIRYD